MNWIRQHRTKLNRAQQVLTKNQWDKLIENGAKNHVNSDSSPVVRFFATCSPATWLLSEAELICDDDGNVVDVSCFGLCDLGMGHPELGYVSLTELIETSRKRFRTQIERDLHFDPKGKPISGFVSK